ncbi:MAG: SpoIIE family protein phosphatase [Acidobacteriota bacterium]
MKNSKLLYLPLLLLLFISAVVFVQHAAPLMTGLGRLIDQSRSVRFPFELRNGEIADVLPEASASGIRVHDRLRAINGHQLTDDQSILREMSKLNVGDNVIYTIERPVEQQSTEFQSIDVPVRGIAISMSIGQTARDLSTPILFLLCLPAISMLLGFYVAFVRPRDPQAWILLFLLLGIASIALEGAPEGTLIKTYQSPVLNSIGIWMVLFGVYFPERLPLDRRYPFIKWLLLVPLILFSAFDLIEQVGRFMSWPAVWRPVDNLTSPFDNVSTILSMIAISTFFACLAIKSATLENRDSRRRLRILYAGTSVAMVPALIIVIYRVISGRTDGFFQLVPSWLAIYALVSMLLFPLTIAYVIIVQRAMDVSVVVRQGLQYALAKNGVLAIQILLSFSVILIAFSLVSESSANRPQKITFIAVGVTLVFVFRLLAGKIRVWMDKKFFREAYDAEQILSDLSDDVRTMVETKPLLETVASKISESLHVPQVALLVRNGANFVPAYALGFDTPPVVSLSEDSSSMRKLRSNRHIVLYDDMTEVTSLPVVTLNEREQLAELNTQMLLPISVKNELSGIISLSPKKSEEPYTTSDIRLLKSVATQTGFAMENSRLTAAVASEAAQKERLNTELDIAREVQERLFPQELPPVQGLDYWGACRPALGVGGDYYDFLELPNGKFGLAIGDISGKGIGASLMMASLQASLRGQTIHYGDDLAALMKQINGLLYEVSTTNRYATFFYAQYDIVSKKLSYVNAGHNPPFLIRKSGEVVMLEDGGPVVGMLPPMLVSYSQGEIQLESGDLLVGYTDGISESMNADEEEWGEDKTLECLLSVTGLAARDIVTQVVKNADAFANGAKQHDDMTMIVVKVI